MKHNATTPLGLNSNKNIILPPPKHFRHQNDHFTILGSEKCQFVPHTPSAYGKLCPRDKSYVGCRGAIEDVIASYAMVLFLISILHPLLRFAAVPFIIIA